MKLYLIASLVAAASAVSAAPAGSPSDVGSTSSTVVPSETTVQSDEYLAIVTEYVTVTADPAVTAGGEQRAGNGDLVAAQPSAIDSGIPSAQDMVVPGDTQDAVEFADTQGAAVPTADITGEAPAGSDDPAPTQDIPSAPSTPEATPAATNPPTSTAQPDPSSTQDQQDDTSDPSSRSNSGGSSDGGSFTGEGTYYTPGLGSCGQTNSESDLVAAINAPQYSAGGSQSGACGKCASVKGPKGEVTVSIVDKCPSCAQGDLDLSPAAFDQIGDQSDGRISIEWSFVNC